jgi:hypothetical protein
MHAEPPDKRLVVLDGLDDGIVCCRQLQCVFFGQMVLLSARRRAQSAPDAFGDVYQ